MQIGEGFLSEIIMERCVLSGALLDGSICIEFRRMKGICRKTVFIENLYIIETYLFKFIYIDLHVHYPNELIYVNTYWWRCKLFTLFALNLKKITTSQMFRKFFWFVIFTNTFLRHFSVVFVLFLQCSILVFSWLTSILLIITIFEESHRLHSVFPNNNWTA